MALDAVLSKKDRTLNRTYFINQTREHELFSLNHNILIIIVICREIVVGEHTLNTSPDCRKSGDFCLPENQTLSVEKVIKHPSWNIAEFYNGYDIALVRVKGQISLYVSFSSSNVLSSSFEPTETNFKLPN